MAEFEIKDLTFELPDKTLFGCLYLPEDAQDGKRVPLVICAHGFSDNHEQCDPYAREFAKRGYAAYCIDFCGGINSRSVNPNKPRTGFTEQEDLEDAYHELSKLPYIDLNNVFLMGLSMGGAIAAMAAAHINNVIKGLILLYPGFSIPNDLRRVYPSLEDIPDNPTLFGIEVDKSFIETAYDFDFYEIIGLYTGPVLILHGMADEVVASGYSVRAVNIYKNANLELIGEVGHKFEGGAFKYAVKKIVGFLDEEADLADESGLNGDLNFGGGMGMFG